MKQNKTPSKQILRKIQKRKFWIFLYTLWIIFIILSQIPNLAQDQIDFSAMDATVESHLRFPDDGRSGHYYVKRYNTSSVGTIDVLYTTSTNSLSVDCTNIKVLDIYCREMYEKKSEDVFKRDPALDSNYYKTYFIERDHFHVQVYTEKTIDQLSFIDAPTPYNVTVNGQEWWLSGINYTYENDGIVLTKVPPGNNYVDIYFKTFDNKAPSAFFTVDKNIVHTNESIRFDASNSSDTDGQIVSYVWDFGEGSYKGGVMTDHYYSREGRYNVILTVTDDDDLIDRAFQEIIVVDNAMTILKTVDKPIAEPGRYLNYTIRPLIDSSWQKGVKDILITDILSPELDYFEAIPYPDSIINNIITWKFPMAFDNNELKSISLRVKIRDSTLNGTIIENIATLNYSGVFDDLFPMEFSNKVTTKVFIDNQQRPKIIEPVADIELREDDPPFSLDLSPYEYHYTDSDDKLRWYLEGENESLYITSGELSVNDIITISPKPNAYGSDLVTLYLVDSDLDAASQPLWINITPINDKPVFANAPDLIVHYNEDYTFYYEPYISDIDTKIEDLSLFTTEKISNEIINGSEPDHLTIDGFKVTYNYPEEFMDEQIFVTLTVNDGSLSDSHTIQINVTDDYTPVLMKELPDIVMYEGETISDVFDLDDYFDDPDEDSLFFSYGETHVSVKINENHTVDISSPSDWYGFDSITFRAKDPIGAIAEDTILITVLPINDPPRIEGVPEVFCVHYDEDYSFDLTPYISDKDNSISELFLILKDNHIRTSIANHLEIIINYPKSMNGMEIPVKLTISDGLVTDFQNVIVKVTDNWPPEMIRELPDVSFYEDEVRYNEFNLNDYFLDQDDKILWYISGFKYINISINKNNSVDFFAPENWFGEELVTFRANDPKGSFKESIITVSVLPVNDPPVIKPIPDIIGTVKKLQKFDLTNYLFDIDNNITELEILVDSEKLDLVVSGRELVIYSDEVLSENVTLIVSDGSNQTSTNVLIDIQGVDVSKPISTDFLTSILWLLILLIIIILSLTGYTTWRKYNGNYVLEEIFWIHNSGLMIFNVSSSGIKHKADSDIMSGMLTGIMGFTQEAFSDEEADKKNWGIKEIQMSGKNILIERGEYTFLASVFTGRSGKKLYKKSGTVLKTIEGKFGKKLEKWDGKVDRLKFAQKVIRSMLPEKK